MNIASNHYPVLLLGVAALLACMALPFQQARASGAYTHAHTAGEAVDYICGTIHCPESAEIKSLLQDTPPFQADRIELFKFAALFPDAFGLGLDDDAAERMHSAHFLNVYAEAIRQECFPRAFGKSCRFRPDIACGNDADCEVRLPSRCTGGAHPICDATGCPGFFNTCNNNNRCDDGERCCYGVTNVCADRGVCSGNLFDDFRTPCFQGGFDCPGPTNICFDNYGDCEEFGVDDLDGKCQRLITHFMGAMAHIVTDRNFDMFFVQTVNEREDCPWQSNAQAFSNCATAIPLSRGLNAQWYTDQEMDGYLARTPPWELHQYLPTSLLVRNDVEDSFLMDVASDLLLLGEQSSLLDTAVSGQWTITRLKTSSLGNLFDLKSCNNETDVDGNPITPPTVCDDFVSNCPVSCSDTSFPGDCSGLSNPFNACNEAPRTCDKDEDCVNGTCEFIAPPNDYSREPLHFLCNWAIEAEHFRHEGGGTVDNARTIARMIERAWSIMRRARAPGFLQTGSAGEEVLDVRICVGSRPAPNCLVEQTFQVIDAVTPGPNVALPGEVSPWSRPKLVTHIETGAGSGHLRFQLQPPRAVDILDCADRRTFDLTLDGSSDEERAAIKVLSDILFKAFIEQANIQVRVEPNMCSALGGYIVKDLRFAVAGSAPPVADAGPDQIVECSSDEGTLVTLDGTGSSDPDGDPLTFSWSAPGITFSDPTRPDPMAAFPVGTTTVTLEVTDPSFASDTDTVDITVQDTTPPEVTISVATDLLWPPNHQLVDVGMTIATPDDCDPTGAVNSLLIEVWSDETEVPERGDGTGRHAPDAKDINTSLRLRGERRGAGNGRVYLIIARAEDASGNVGFGYRTVVVPKAQSPAALADVAAQAAAALAVVESAPGTTIAEKVASLGFHRHGVSVMLGPHQ